MNATPKPKRAATPSVLPTFQQAVAMAIAKAEHDLKTIVSIRCADEYWKDEDADVDGAVELALCHIQRMKGTEFLDFCNFSTEWCKAAAAINLGCKAFSRDDCAYKRFLTGANEMFRQTADMVEFILMA